MTKMRDREEIEVIILESDAENNGRDTIALIQLEVLLDIRDLLEATKDSAESLDLEAHGMRTLR